MKKLTAFLCIIMFAVTGCSKNAQTRTVEGEVTGQGASIDTDTSNEDYITISSNMAKPTIHW